MQATTAPAAAISSPPVINPTLPLQRLASVDVYRGFVMLLMMAEMPDVNATGHVATPAREIVQPHWFTVCCTNAQLTA